MHNFQYTYEKKSEVSTGGSVPPSKEKTRDKLLDERVRDAFKTMNGIGTSPSNLKRILAIQFGPFSLEEAPALPR